MLIQGVRAALPILQLGAWLRGLSSPAHSNTMVVALAAKMTRIAWALLRHERYFEMKALPF